MILFLCMAAVLSLVIAVLMKGRSKLKVTHLSSRLPQQVDLDTAENIAYGVSLSAHASSS